MAIGSRRLLGVAGALLIGLVFTALAGPRVDVSVEYAPFPEGVDLETWVRERAQEFDDIVPGTEHRLVWADSVAHRQTALSVVYLHGFSGTSAMAYPFVDSLAARLGANAYLPRLTGHGRTGEAFGEATLHEWIQDTADALAIGARLGEKVVLVGLSNGGALAAWAALQPDLAAQLEALVLLSPNIKPVDGSAEMLLWPWGVRLAEAVVGKTREWEPFTDAHGRYSTNRYPTKVLGQMMATVELLRRQDVARLSAPVLMILSDQDEVVSAAASREFFARIPTAKELVEVGNTGDPNNHVIVGDALSPDQTMPTVGQVVRFLATLQS